MIVARSYVASHPEWATPLHTAVLAIDTGRDPNPPIITFAPPGLER